MNNNISLTIRLPNSLNVKLTDTSKSLGLTKVSFIRFAIWNFLDEHPQPLTFTDSTENTFRLVLAVNQNTYEILERACQQHNQSINSIVIAVSVLALERYAKYL